MSMRRAQHRARMNSPQTPSPQDRSPADLSLKRHPLCVALGAVLRRRRLAQGHTAYQLAARARVARQTVANAEAGRRALTFDTLARLSDALAVATSRLVAEAEGGRG